MPDFISIKKDINKNKSVIHPEFKVRSQDLMTRGHGFYAVWDEDNGTWETDENCVIDIVNKELDKYAEDNDPDHVCKICYLDNYNNGQWKIWKQFLKDSLNRFHVLNSSVKFQDDILKKTDYATYTLDYPLGKDESDIEAYDKVMGTLYSDEERQKLEWAIGSVFTGDSRKIQKFVVLYGPPGTGKSTFLKIVRDLFQGYVTTFSSRSLISKSNAFPLEGFKEGPLIAIEDDGDLSRIEDNTILNSIVSHEKLMVNEKYHSPYEMKFETMLFMGTNKPVKITDAKSGLLRRLIDVSPTGDLLPKSEYDTLMSRVHFERPSIAKHCIDVYNSLGPDAYDGYKPKLMMQATNDTYNFVIDNWDLFQNIGDDGLSLSVLWRRYREYVDEAGVKYPLPMRVFKEELRNYFCRFEQRHKNQTSVYFDFKADLFQFGYEVVMKEVNGSVPEINEDVPDWLKLESRDSSILDEEWSDCFAQYAKDDKPSCAWKSCKTKLKDIDPTKTHYVLPPDKKYIVIDLDKKNEKGEKDVNINVAVAKRFPPTYVERSKGGAGLHLHYIYTGDTSLLAHLVEEDVEIKVFNGNSSLRRRLSECNNLPMAEISTGLPTRKVKKMLNNGSIKSEKKLRELVIRGINKKIWPNTAPSMDFIKKILDEAYESGLKYDLRDMRQDVLIFAMNSTHQAEKCVKMIDDIKWCSEEEDPNVVWEAEAPLPLHPIIFFDCEVFPNLFVICWKPEGKERAIRTAINPTPQQVEELFKYKLVGFNNRDYDNHILYAASMGYSNAELFKLSQRIISGDKTAKFGKAYNLSYTDIYDFLSSQNKMSLKKWEIKLGIHHEELGLPWDQPVPEELWEKVSKYCCYDVEATEAVFEANQADWRARQILAEWSGLSVNDKTNSHTIKLIVGDDKHPQDKFVYTDLSTIFPSYEYSSFGIDKSRYKEGTKIVKGKSIYMGIDPGEGGFAWGNPGMYRNVALLDVESMHPHSIIRLNMFGDEATKRFEDILDARLLIKHKDFDGAKRLLPERLHKYLDDPSEAKSLSNALKTAINSVYGLTSAAFDNKLRDNRNKDNIVAKYGALFMITLREEVQKRGYTVVHIKTDSIKIANADNDIIKFCMDFAKQYGFTFAHEATYRKMCIVNDAVYIAQYESADKCLAQYGYVPDDCNDHGLKWTATGTQFQVPYVFKTLFSHEQLEFKDMFEIKSVQTALYLDYNETLDNDEHDYRFVGKVGCFVPVVEGVGGGILCRSEKDGRMSAVAGTKKPDGKSAYRWLEAETFEKLNIGYDKIDKSYYDELANDAVDTISKYGDFERFKSSDPNEDLSWMDNNFMNPPE